MEGGGIRFLNTIMIEVSSDTGNFLHKLGRA